MPSLTASAVLTAGGVIEPATVTLEAGVIKAVSPPAGSVPERILAPGFVDLQVNGVEDLDVAEAHGSDWDRIDGLLLAQGVTSWCPTLITAPLAALEAALGRIDAAARRPASGRPTLIGAHLEGPFINERTGAHPVEWTLPPDLDWLEKVSPQLSVVTLAPELPRACDVTAALAAKGVLVAAGHSAASYEEAILAVDAGVRLATHLFNGMGPLHHRQPGLVGAALSDDRVTVSLIADLWHVHPAVLKWVFRAKGRGRVALVTDSVAQPASEGRKAPGTTTAPPRLADGTLVGSVLTMPAAVKNLVERAEVTLADALIAGSATPAQLLGIPYHGVIAPGSPADLTMLSPSLEVEATWIQGELAWEAA